MMKFSMLAFDSDLFGFKVARIESQTLHEGLSLRKLLMELSVNDVQLAYFSTDVVDTKSAEIVELAHGICVAKQITYEIDISRLPSFIAADEHVSVYSGNPANEELEYLAIQAGTFSRFKSDPQFPYNLFLKLYIEWIHNAVTGQNNGVVLVYKKEPSSISGMISLENFRSNEGEKKIGRIGLIAVAAELRGKGIASKLIQSAQVFFRTRNYDRIRVVTQGANDAACHLYEKCGFKKIKEENFYHFWLN